jgi:RNA polymerase sigma factor (sigma-70 family)
MSKKEDLDKLTKAMDELKPDYRQAIILTKIDGLSYEEIGIRLDKSPDAVRMLATRAMVALAAAFRRI